MRAGAMDDAGYRRTRHGHALGVLGTLVAIAPVVIAVVMFLKELSQAL
jgi:hypothetical protein